MTIVYDNWCINASNQFSCSARVMHENIQSYSNLITLKNKEILTDELWYLSWQLLRFAFLWEPGCFIGMMRVLGLGRQRATLGSVLPNATSIFRRQQWLFLLFFLSVVNSCPCLTHGEFDSLLSQNCFCSCWKTCLLIAGKSRVRDRKEKDVYKERRWTGRIVAACTNGYQKF